MVKFSLGGELCGTAKFRTPTTIIIIFKLVTMPNMVEFVILEPKLARVALSWVARQKSGGTKGKNDNNRFTLQTAAGNCWHEREARLLSKSTCVVIPFVVLHCSCDFFRHELICTTSQLLKWLQLFFLAVSRPDRSNCHERDGRTPACTRACAHFSRAQFMRH